MPVPPQALRLCPTHTSLNPCVCVCRSLCANFVAQAAAARKAAKRATAKDPGGQGEEQEEEQEDEAQESEDEGCASDHRFVYMGPRGSWTALHADVLRSFSWSFNVCGRKRWLLFPPQQVVPLPQPAMPLLHRFPACGRSVLIPLASCPIWTLAYISELQRSVSEGESQTAQ